MGSNNISGWLIALIGTIATVVGAIAAVITVAQNRRAPNRDSESAEYIATNSRSFPYEARRSRSLKDSLGVSHSEVPEMLAITLWIVLILLIAWMIKILGDMRPDTVPVFLLMSPPALGGFFTGILSLVASFGQLFEDELILSIWHLVVVALDALIVVVAIKVCL